MSVTDRDGEPIPWISMVKARRGGTGATPVSRARMAHHEQLPADHPEALLREEMRAVMRRHVDAGLSPAQARVAVVVAAVVEHRKILEERRRGRH